MGPELVLNSGHPEASTDRFAYRMIDLRTCEVLWLAPFNEYFTPVALPRKVLPRLPPVASLVFYRRTFDFLGFSFSVLLCIRSPLHIVREFDTYASRYTELCGILEHLFSAALSQRASRGGSSFSERRL